jgi:hypothetical protein
VAEPSQLRCPYCRAEFGDTLCTFCDGCKTMYHRECAQELKECGTRGCNTKVRIKEELPLTGTTIGSFNPRPLVLIGFAVGVLPFAAVLEWWLIKEGKFSAAVLFAIPVLGMFLLGALPMLTGGRRLGRIFIGR